MDVPSKHSATRVCCPDQVNAGKRVFKNNTEERFSQFQKFTAKTTIEKTNAKKRRKKQTATKTRQSLVLNSKRSRFLSFSHLFGFFFCFANVYSESFFCDTLPATGWPPDFIKVSSSFFPATAGSGRASTAASSRGLCTPEPQPRVPEGPWALPDVNHLARSQRALPDLNRGWLSLNTAGPQLRVPDLSGHRPNRELSISVGTAGPQPRASDLIGHCRTSTASARCQIECQIESQNKYQ